MLRLHKIVHPTPSGGFMAPLWNALDGEFSALYVYSLKCVAGEKKGPYCHIKRTAQLHLLTGKVRVLRRPFRGEAFKEETLETSPTHIQCLVLPKMVEYSIEALEDSVLLNICDYPWIEGEQETM